MSRSATGRATSLEGALTDAVAALLDVEPEKVELELAAPGLGDVTGTVELRLEVTSGDRVRAGRSQDAGQDDEPPAERASRDDDRDEDDRDGGRRDDREEQDGGRGRRDDAYVATPEELEEEADAAADFLEGLLDALDLPGDLRITIHDDHAELEIVDIGSGALIGRRGQTLEAIQELVRCTLQRQFQRRSRIKIDAEGYRARRLEKLLEKAEEAIDEVLDSGEPQRLEPMDVFERKTVHQLVAEVDGLVSRSQGREPARRVIIERG